MKYIINIAIAFAFIKPAIAQVVKVDKILPLDAITVIVLELHGNAHLSLNKQNELKMESLLTPKGSVIGWSFDSERPPFEINYQISNDTLFVSSPQKWDQKVVGVDLYTEQVDTKIYFPEHSNVIVKSADKLVIDNSFSRFKVLECRVIEYSGMDTSDFGLMICNASRRLTIGGLKYKLNHEIEGTGTGYYLLKAETIFIY